MLLWLPWGVVPALLMTEGEGFAENSENPPIFHSPGGGCVWQRAKLGAIRRCLCKPARPGRGAGAWSASPSEGAAEKPGDAALALFLLLFLCFFFFVFQSRTTERDAFPQDGRGHGGQSGG